MRNISYNTKQKDRIHEIVKNKNKSFTIKEIYDDLNKEIGLTTIYRFITKLEKEGLVRKEASIEGNAYYEYLERCEEENHFYLKCDNCGKLIHIDCDCISDLTKHILNEHSFSLNKKKIIINGLCKECTINN